MAFTGELHDCRSADLLTAVALSGHSGRLRISHRHDEGLVIFDRGRVLYAATSTVRETLGSILIAQGQITSDQLEAALDLQQTTENRRLGSILVGQEIITEEIVAAAVEEQIRGALSDLLRWRSGHFDFQPLQSGPEGQAGVDLSKVVPESDLSSDEVVRGLADRLERGLAESPIVSDYASRLALLKRTATQLRSPQFTGELVVKILDFARQTVRRGVLFLVRPDGFQGIGHVGIEVPGVNPNQLIRNLTIPLDEPSVLLEAADRQEVVTRPVAADGRDDRLIEGLGGGIPHAVLAVPMLVRDQVMTVLYADNLPVNEPIGAVDELELLMIQAGMSIEKNLFHRRLEQYEKLRNLDPNDELEA